MLGHRVVGVGVAVGRVELRECCLRLVCLGEEQT